MRPAEKEALFEVCNLASLSFAAFVMIASKDTVSETIGSIVIICALCLRAVFFFRERNTITSAQNTAVLALTALSVAIYAV